MIRTEVKLKETKERVVPKRNEALIYSLTKITYSFKSPYTIYEIK